MFDSDWDMQMKQYIRWMKYMYHVSIYLDIHIYYWFSTCIVWIHSICFALHRLTWTYNTEVYVRACFVCLWLYQFYQTSIIRHPVYILCCLIWNTLASHFRLHRTGVAQGEAVEIISSAMGMTAGEAGSVESLGVMRWLWDIQATQVFDVFCWKWLVLGIQTKDPKSKSFFLCTVE